MYNVWIISDEKHPYLKMYLNKNKKHFKIKLFDKEIVEMMETEGTPDIIIIDTSMIQGQIPSMLGCYDTIFANLKYFAEKHISSTICIASYVSTWAEDFMDDLKAHLPDSFIEQTKNGDQHLAEYLISKLDKKCLQ